MNVSVLTVSKYPPYRSGHAQQALWNNSALAETTGQTQHQIDYLFSDEEGEVSTNEVQIHRPPREGLNTRVSDGNSVTAMSATIFKVVHSHSITHILTYYADPHAAAVNRAMKALSRIGSRPTVIHSIEGSDVLSSMRNHTTNGLAAVIVADYLAADVLHAVSNYTKHQFLSVAEEVYGPALRGEVEERIQVRYPGLPSWKFVPATQEAQKGIRRRLDIPMDSIVISTAGRLAPEKGYHLFLEISDVARRDGVEVTFVIAGSGPMADVLRAESREHPNVRLALSPSEDELHALRSTSALALIPTRLNPSFVETFCVSALEYEALGVPVLATDIGGVNEAVARSDFLMRHEWGPDEWWRRARQLIKVHANGQMVQEFARQFTDLRAVGQILGAAPDRVNGSG